jgi:hypothetical protein
LFGADRTPRCQRIAVTEAKNDESTPDCLDRC